MLMRAMKTAVITGKEERPRVMQTFTYGVSVNRHFGPACDPLAVNVQFVIEVS
jgi:hypothetical protein